MIDASIPKELQQPVPRDVKSLSDSMRANTFLCVTFAIVVFGGMTFWGPFPFKMTLWIVGIPAVCCAIGFWVYGYNYRFEKKLIQWGAVAHATITEERDVTTSGRYSVTCGVVSYKFKDSYGEEIVGTHGYLPSSRDRAQSADAVTLYDMFVANPIVLYDQTFSKRSILYPGVCTDRYTQKLNEAKAAAKTDR